MISARFEFDGWNGWREMPCMGGPGYFEQIAIRMQTEALLLRLKAWLALIETREWLEAA